MTLTPRKFYQKEYSRLYDESYIYILLTCVRCVRIKRETPCYGVSRLMYTFVHSLVSLSRFSLKPYTKAPDIDFGVRCVRILVARYRKIFLTLRHFFLTCKGLGLNIKKESK
jgi:hypothetical protein